MGLDQRMVVRPSKKWNPDCEFFSHTEIGSWRKHYSLQRWMKQLWIKKGFPGLDMEYYIEGHPKEEYFSSVYLNLTKKDLHRLNQDVKNLRLPTDENIFYGSDTSKAFKFYDMQVISTAVRALDMGYPVYFNSDW